MNVDYTNYTPNDLAKLIGVDGSSIRQACRSGLIKAINVSDGNTNARWLIPDEEVNRVCNLVDRFGKDRWKEKAKLERLVPEPVKVPELEEQIDKSTDAVINGINMNRVADVAYKIADIKEELNNIEARKNQLESELNDLRTQVLDALGL